MSDDIMALAADLKKAADEVKTIAETTNTEIKNLGEATAETKIKADEALMKHAEISARLTEIEQKMVRGAQEPEQRKSLGQMVTDSDEIQALMKGQSGRARVSVKAIISAATSNAAGSAGALIDPDRRGLIAPLERRLTVRDLLAPGRTSSNAVQYMKETAFTNAAAGQSETAGLEKADSDLQFEMKTTPVATLAHWVQATKQILDDVPMLQSYIDGRLLYGLKLAEEDQILNGNGTNNGLDGIYNQATVFAPGVTVAAPTKLDVLRLAMLQVHLTELPPDGIVINPKVWAEIELTKDAGLNYILANPASATSRSLWGLPVVETQSMASTDYVVGAFGMGAQIFDREDASVEISTENDKNFTKNLVTILAEERLALAVYRPEAFIKGVFTTDTSTATTQ